MKYKCAIIKIDDKVYCFTLRKDGSLTEGYCITDIDQIYQDLNESQVCLGLIEFKDIDGNPVELEDSPDMTKVIFLIEPQKNVVITEDEAKKSFVSVKLLLQKSHFEEVMREFFADKDIYSEE